MPALLGLDDRRELEVIAEREHLHAAERDLELALGDAQCDVDCVEQIGAHHRNLVDDEELKGEES